MVNIAWILKILVKHWLISVKHWLTFSWGKHFEFLFIHFNLNQWLGKRTAFYPKRLIRKCNKVQSVSHIYLNLVWIYKKGDKNLYHLTDYSVLRPWKLCKPNILYIDVHLCLVLLVSCSEHFFSCFFFTCNFIPLTITEQPTIECRTH